MKKNNKYRLTLDEITLKDNPNPTGNLQFEFENHDDILSILEKIKQKNIFDENTNKEFAVGLKLFSEVLLINRKHELFKDFFPHFSDFMKKLKAM
ncbi:DUF3861 domain-containing protein [Winogradskyella sp. MH6]|uniref:DUF3861 domain-containing protein n=1 Tax=Winogradskyella sp. MH6 TaxID=2929510 RepID=UPI001FB2C207|nr:DUF3861 domain-containing protein [Winogradskyella sp. MH6]